MSERARVERERGPLGILCALPEELGSLAERTLSVRGRFGLELCEIDLGGETALACVGGVGKVQAAHAAALLLAEGVGALVVVGVCGGLVRGLAAGDFVHCSAAVQADLGLRGAALAEPSAELLEAWLRAAPGRRGIFVTRDRAAITPWRRMWLARSFGATVVDMETAAAGRVAARAGVPWAALRAVTDGRWRGGALAFSTHFGTHAGRAADTVPALARALANP